MIPKFSGLALVAILVGDGWQVLVGGGCSGGGGKRHARQANTTPSPVLRVASIPQRVPVRGAGWIGQCGTTRVDRAMRRIGRLGSAGRPSCARARHFGYHSESALVHTITATSDFVSPSPPHLRFPLRCAAFLLSSRPCGLSARSVAAVECRSSRKTRTQDCDCKDFPIWGHQGRRMDTVKVPDDTEHDKLRRLRRRRGGATLERGRPHKPSLACRCDNPHVRHRTCAKPSERAAAPQIHLSEASVRPKSLYFRHASLKRGHDESDHNCDSREFCAVT